MKIWAACLLLTLLSACSGGESTPEQRIRELIGEAEAAAESRSRGLFDEIVSDAYQDQAGRGRRELLRLIQGYFLANQSIHLLVRIQQVTVEGPETASAVVYAGMAGSPVAGFEQLLAMRAAVYRLDLGFTLDADPKLVSAQWRRLEPGELIP